MIRLTKIQKLMFLGINKIKVMDRFDIETSFKRIDSKFAEALTEQEKQKALKQFRSLYAQQMSKLATQIERRQKVQENLNSINEKQKSDARDIDDELRKRMEKHNANREKRQESKQKEHKMMEENWRRKYEEIIRKNRQKERDAYQKAQKTRKDVESYWNKKNETVQLRENSFSDRKSETVKPYYSLSRVQHNKRTIADTQYDVVYQKSKKVKFNFPSLGQRNDLDNSKVLNRSIGQSTINDEIRSHQQKSLKEGKEVQEEKIKNLLERLEKIEKTRRNAKEKIEKHINEAKKIREYRENPEVLQANRKKSIAQFRKANLKKSEGSKQNLSYSPSKSKVNLSDSIHQHLMSKQRLKEIQFEQREQVFEQKKKKIKQTKINRLVRDAINMIKHQALNELSE